MTIPRCRRAWVPAEDAVLRARYADTPTADLAVELHRSAGAVYQRAQSLGLGKSAAYFAQPISGRLTAGDTRGAGSRFRKGQIPANKGLRRPGWGPGRMKDTQFKRGERRGVAAKNWRPIGTVLADTEGYLRIKVREPLPGEPFGFGNVQAWPLLQRHIWTQAHGAIPPGHNVVFRDGDKTRCTLDNLELVSRAEMMRRNSVHNLPKPLASTIQLLGALKRQIRKRDRHGREEQDSGLA